MVELGLAFELTSVNGEYDYRYTLRSRYFRSPINVYSQGNGNNVLLLYYTLFIVYMYYSIYMHITIY